MKNLIIAFLFAVSLMACSQDDDVSPSKQIKEKTQIHFIVQAAQELQPGQGNIYFTATVSYGVNELKYTDTYTAKNMVYDTEMTEDDELLIKVTNPDKPLKVHVTINGKVTSYPLVNDQVLKITI